MELDDVFVFASVTQNDNRSISEIVQHINTSIGLLKNGNISFAYLLNGIATKLGRAIHNNNICEVKACLAIGENPLSEDRKGNTYMHYICTMYRPYIFHIMLATGIDINAQNKDGNTALHVTALHDEAGHVADLMACSIDYHLKNKDGKEAYQLVTVNKHWMDIFNKYQPGLRQAIASHDTERVQYLFGCWCSVEQITYGKDARQFAAHKTHHDIVAMIDKVKISLKAVYAVLQCDRKKLEYALKRNSCDVNYLQKIDGCHRHHILQHAVAQNDPTMVNTILQAKADVNVPVQIKEYLTGPLYFEAISSSHYLNRRILRDIVMKRNCDLSLKDERGRSTLMYTIDKTKGEVTLDLIDHFLSNGIDIAQRDDTGCSARDIAMFSRRRDVIKAIDQYVVDLIGDSNITKLRQLSIGGYDHFFFEHMSRDTWIHAAGNETDAVTVFLKELPKYQKLVKNFHEAVTRGGITKLQQMLEDYEDKNALLKSKDKGGRGPLIKAILFGQFETARWLLIHDGELPLSEKDNLYRNPLHYVMMYGSTNIEAKNLKESLVQYESLKKAIDCKGLTPTQFVAYNRLHHIEFIESERKAVYGMELELNCLHMVRLSQNENKLRDIACIMQYEQLLRVIRSDTKKLRDFDKILKTIKYPLRDFPKVLANEDLPLVPKYRDLLLAAIDHEKLDIAERLVRIGVNCNRKEKYNDKESERFMDAFDRCEKKGYNELLIVMRKYAQN